MTGTMEHIVTVYLAIIREFLSPIMHYIVPMIAMACAPGVPSRMEWEDPLKVLLILCNSIRSLKTNGRRS